MKTEIKKCDRCKKQVDELVDFRFINTYQTIPPPDDFQEDKHSFASMMGIGSRRAHYPTVEGELCLDCIQEISRWLGHQENVLCNHLTG